jgi:formylglycine-generating enzyme required for sulfatase activity
MPIDGNLRREVIKHFVALGDDPSARRARLTACLYDYKVTLDQLDYSGDDYTFKSRVFDTLLATQGERVLCDFLRCHAAEFSGADKQKLMADLIAQIQGDAPPAANYPTHEAATNTAIAKLQEQLDALDRLLHLLDGELARKEIKTGEYYLRRDSLMAQRQRLTDELRQLSAQRGQPNPPPIIATDSAPHQTPQQTAGSIRQAVREDGTAVVTLDNLKEVAEAKPLDLTAYYTARIAEWSQPRYALDKRFVYLTLLIDKGEDEQQRFQPQERTFSDLRELLASRQEEQAFVVLGAPGSGKSTLLRRFQLDVSREALRDNGDRVSFFIQLNLYRGEDDPRAWLNAQWSERYPDLPPLDHFLKAGKATLLLDALNEMPHRSREEYNEKVMLWREFTQQAVRQGNTLIYSCRSLDYSAVVSSTELRVPQIDVQPMNADQVRGFLTAYLPERADSIWGELHGTPQFALFQTPFFLKLLLDQIEAYSTIPKGRAELFARFVRGALEREILGGNPLFMPNGLLTTHDHLIIQRKARSSGQDLPNDGLLIDKLSQLAFNMQATRKRPDGDKEERKDGGTVLVKVKEARELLASERAEDILQAGIALAVLDKDADLNVKFFHQLLQEFFAARQLAEHPNPELVRSAWRADAVKPSLADELAKLPSNDPLPTLPTTGWEETTVLAATMSADPDGFVRGLIEPNLVLAARCAASADVRVSEGLKAELRQLLIARSQDFSVADLRARIAAGLALGNLGDPRFERRTGPHGDYLMPPLVTIAGGEYPMGLDDSQYDDEKPAHTVTLEAFQMGAFPVTNAEYGLFMAAGGYEDERWWETDAAKAWRVGEGSSEGSKQQWRDNRKTLQSWTEAYIQDLVNQNRVTPKQAEDWIIIRGWTDERFEQQLEEWYPSGVVHRQPEYWEDSNFNNPNQPVVGVTWFETRAYCAWLTAQTGLRVDLPTEAQFEAAARGTGGLLYPYGNTSEVSRGNTFESHIRRTTPIAIFDNATALGAYDLSGNAYTWTLSLYDQEQFPYPYRAEDGRENISSVNRRVLRGGSWNDDRNDARAVDRYGYGPGSRVNDSGFRVCVPIT